MGLWFSRRQVFVATHTDAAHSVMDPSLCHACPRRACMLCSDCSLAVCAGHLFTSNHAQKCRRCVAEDWKRDLRDLASVALVFGTGVLWLWLAERFGGSR